MIFVLGYLASRVAGATPKVQDAAVSAVLLDERINHILFRVLDEVPSAFSELFVPEVGLHSSSATALLQAAEEVPEFSESRHTLIFSRYIASAREQVWVVPSVGMEFSYWKIPEVTAVALTLVVNRKIRLGLIVLKPASVIA